MNLRSTLRWTVLAATVVAAGFASTSLLTGSVMPTLSCPANLSTTLTFSEGDFPAVEPFNVPRYSTPNLAPTGGTLLTNQFQSAGVLFSATSPSQAWTYLAAQPDPSVEKILSSSEGVLLSSIMLGANPGNTTITTTIRFVNPSNGSAITARGSSIGLWAYGRGPGPLTFKSYNAAGTLLETKTIPGFDGSQVLGTVQFTTGDVARIEAVNTGLPQQGLAIDDLQYTLNLSCPAPPQSSSAAAASCTQQAVSLTFSEHSPAPIPATMQNFPRYGINNNPPHYAPWGGSLNAPSYVSDGLSVTVTPAVARWVYVAAGLPPLAAGTQSPASPGGPLLSTIIQSGIPQGEPTELPPLITKIRFVDPASGANITAVGSSIRFWAYSQTGNMTFTSYDSNGTLLETKTVPASSTVQFTTGNVAYIEGVSSYQAGGIAIDNLQYTLNRNCPAQPQSSSAQSSTPVGVQCSDGADNDGDGLTDFPADLGCYAANDTDELNPTVDLKINGQNGTITVAPGTPVTLSWTSTDAMRCDTGTSPAPWGPYKSKPANGSEQFTPTATISFGMQCAETATSGMVVQDADVAVVVAASSAGSTASTCYQAQFRAENGTLSAQGWTALAPAANQSLAEPTTENGVTYVRMTDNSTLRGMRTEYMGIPDSALADRNWSLSMKARIVASNPNGYKTGVNMLLTSPGGRYASIYIDTAKFGPLGSSATEFDYARTVNRTTVDGFHTYQIDYHRNNSGVNDDTFDVLFDGQTVLAGVTRNELWNSAASGQNINGISFGIGTSPGTGTMDVSSVQFRNTDTGCPAPPSSSISSSSSSAAPLPANCDDGIDNDGDGFTDKLKTAAVQRRSFATADAVRDAINALGGSRVPVPARSMEFGCGSNAFGATSDAGFCAGLGYDGYEGAVCSYSACGAGGNPKVDANAYWSGPQVIRDDCNTWYQKNHTTWHNYLSSVTCLDNAACGDGKDNDFDGKIDMQDTGCANADDDSEAQHDTSCDSGTSEGAAQVNECADGIDNDGDGKIDRTQTSSLSTRLFTSPGEIAATINALGSARVPTPLAAMEFGCGTNGLGTASDAGFCGLLGYGSKTSNCLYSACGAGGEPKVTGNGYISGTRVLREDCNGWYLRARTTWHNYLHAAECVTGTQCSDGTDNDGDGLIDHPADIGCASANDTSEVEADPECATGSRETPTATSSSVRTSSSAGPPPPPDVLNGIFARYTFDDGNANDVSGNNRNGTPSGGPKFSNKCLLLDGVDDRVALPNFDMPAFTASAWVKKENNAKAQWTPLIIGGDGHNGWGLGFAAGDSIYSIDGNVGPSRLMLTNMGWSNVRTKNDIAPGEFHHVAVTYDNTQGKGIVSFYIDGIAQAQSYPGGQPAFNNQGKPYGLGWISAPLGPVAYKGLLDDVRVYNRVLSAGEITSVSKQPPSCGTLAVPQCKDGIDNDKNGKVDYPADSGCETADDFTEGANPPDTNPPGLLSCLAGGEKGPTVVDFNAAPGVALTDQFTGINGLLIEPLNGSTAIPETPVEKEFKTIKRVVNVTAPGGAPKVAIHFVNPETKAKITVPGNTLRVLVGRKTAGGAIVGRSYDYTGTLVEEWRSTSLQAYLSFSLWHVEKVELFAEDGGAFYFDNVGYGPLECTPFTEAYVRPSSSSRTSSSRSSVRSSSLTSSSRSSVRTSGASVTSSLRSVTTSGRSSSRALSSISAPSAASQRTSSVLVSSKAPSSAARQSARSSARFSLPSITLPPGTSSLSNEQLRNILSLQFPEIPVDSFFPLPEGFFDGQENPDGVTLDISQAGKAKSSSSAMSALAVSWLDEWLPWRAAAPEEDSSSSVTEGSAPAESATSAVSSSFSKEMTDDSSSVQSMPAAQQSSVLPTPPSSDEYDAQVVTPVSLSEDGMPLWWWIVLIVGAILGLLLGMYVTNRLLAPKEE